MAESVFVEVTEVGELPPGEMKMVDVAQLEVKAQVATLNASWVKLAALDTHLCSLFERAYKDKAWIPLGYQTWADFFHQEFFADNTKTSARLLDENRIINHIEDWITKSD